MKGLAHRIQWSRLAAGAAFAGLLSAPGLATAQTTRENIVGAWQYVAIYNEEGGVKRHLFGDKPVGLMVFDRSGYVISFLSKPDLPKLAGKNRLKGTDSEYRDVMQGMIAGFGTYKVNGDSVTIQWVASSFPNRAGTSEQRTYKVAGNEMSSVNPVAASGGTSYAKFVRARQAH